MMGMEYLAWCWSFGRIYQKYRRICGYKFPTPLDTYVPISPWNI
jgi:hypothetical protein